MLKVVEFVESEAFCGSRWMPLDALIDGLSEEHVASIAGVGAVPSKALVRGLAQSKARLQELGSLTACVEV